LENTDHRGAGNQGKLIALITGAKGGLGNFVTEFLVKK
jgi:hypothetical protein